jgi:hypothetical protein
MADPFLHFKIKRIECFIFHGKYFFLSFCQRVDLRSAVNGSDPPHKAVSQANLYPVGMSGGFCQNIPDDAFGKLSGFLVLL